MRVGITGHSNLTADAEPAVAAALEKVLAEIGGPVVGVTCLARGSDQIGAQVVLDLGGDVEVILPAADYHERKVKPDNREMFEALLLRASAARVLPFDTANRAAYMAARRPFSTTWNTSSRSGTGSRPTATGAPATSSQRPGRAVCR